MVVVIFAVAIVFSPAKVFAATGDILTAGAGFAGPTIVSSVGLPSDPGYNDTPIARWLDVPLGGAVDASSIIRTGVFKLGVAAFHINGITKVQFSLDGGGWVDADTMTNNDEVRGGGAYSYWVRINTTGLSDGVHEVRARAIPTTAGQERVLQGDLSDSTRNSGGKHSYFFITNESSGLSTETVYVSPSGSDATGDGSSGSPYATPGKAVAHLRDSLGSTGIGTVKYAAGSYAWDPSIGSYWDPIGWVTHEPADGVSRNQVKITSYTTGGIISRKNRLHNLTIEGQFGFRQAGINWFDEVYDDGLDNTVDFTRLNAGSWSSGDWITSSITTRSLNGLRSSSLMLNHTVLDTSGSPFGGSCAVINSSVNEYSHAGFHGDVFHWFRSVTDRSSEAADANCLVYNVYADDFTTQGIFAESLADGGTSYFDNVALINLHISGDGGAPYYGNWWEMSTRHLIMRYVNLPDGLMRWALSSYNNVLEDVEIQGSIFLAWSNDEISSTSNGIVNINHNHFISTSLGTPEGSDSTTGEPRFTDQSGKDYRLDPTSPLVDRISSSLVPADIDGNTRPSPDNIGAFATEQASATPWPSYPVKPSTAILNTRDALADTFTAIFPIDEGSGTTLRDLLGGASLSNDIQVGTPSWIDVSYGKAVLQPRYRRVLETFPTTSFQLVSVFQWNGTAVSAHVFGIDTNANNSQYTNIGVITSGGVHARHLATVIPGSQNLADSEPVVAIAQFTKSGSQFSPAIYLYRLGGDLIESVGTTTATATFTPTHLTMGYQETSGPTYNSILDGGDSVSFAAITNNLWNETQRNAFAADPWSILEGSTIQFEDGSTNVIGSLDFGIVNEEDSIASQQITIRNTSGASVTLGAVSIGAPFSVADNLEGTVLANNGTAVVTVNADSSSAGSYIVNLSIPHNGVDSPNTLPIALEVQEADSIPTVSLTAPTEAATISGNVAVSADASDDVAVVGVQFKLDTNTLIGDDTSEPYSITWDSTTVDDGAHSLIAVARDAAGNRATSSAVNITVDNSVPVVTHTITATAGAHGSIDPVGVVSVTDGTDQVFTITPDSGYNIATLVVDDVSVSTATTYTFSNVTADHTISATFELVPVVTHSSGGSINPYYLRPVIPTPVTPTIPAFTFTRDLKLGVTGIDVKNLQIFLNTHGYTVATAGAGSLGQETLYFGPATQAALIRYQKANNITPAVGYFGTITRASVYLASLSPTQPTATSTPTASSTTQISLPSHTFTTPLAFGQTHPDIIILQKLLNTDPDTRIAATGIGSLGQETTYFGTLTLDAVKRFQIKYNIAKSGEHGFGNVGPKTRAKLNELQ